jgi:hypothetical protein
MCKEMPVITVNEVVDQKELSEKMEGRGGGKAQGVADPPKKQENKVFKSLAIYVRPLARKAAPYPSAEGCRTTSYDQNYD